MLAAAFTWASAAVKADEPSPTGEQIYSKQCVDCHGAKGEGVKGEREEPLVGDWSLEKLTKYVTKNMPEDKPKLCEGEDARRVAKFVFDAFYSLEAQLRNNPARVATSRLTTRQFRESVADLFIREPASKPASEPGLKGFYFVSKGMNKKDGLKKTQVDERIDFDFGGHQLSAHLAEEGGAEASNRVDGDSVPVRHFGLVLPWDQWHALAQRLGDRGVDFLIEPRVRFQGELGEQATMFLRDPSGNALEFKSFADPARLFASD